MRCHPSDVKFPDTGLGNFAQPVVYLSAIAFPLAIVGR
jgi:hypothetical protein